MEALRDWVSYQCSCGFRLDRVPRQVMAEVPRCLGCGRPLRSGGQVKTRGFGRVGDLR